MQALFANLLAQEPDAKAVSTVSSAFEWDWPYSAGDWSVLIGLLLTAVWAIVIARRDTRDLHPIWMGWLSVLRLAMLGCLLVIALNPHFRTQRESFRSSQVTILVDTSTSMKQPAVDRSPGASVIERAEVVQSFLETSPLIESLRARHAVDIYTFDSDVTGPIHRFAWLDPHAESRSASEPRPDWKKWLTPARNATALGDAVDKVLAEQKGRPLSGVVLVSDGASNLGRSPDSAISRAKQQGVKLMTLGIGGTTPPVDLAILKLVSPTDVAKGDAFELNAWVQGRGLPGQNATVELLQRGPQDSEPIVVETQSVPVTEGDAALGSSAQEVQFSRTLTEAGEFEYTVRVTAGTDVLESRVDNNSESRTINVFDRPTRVLIIAGGPMRDYIFTKNLLYRHKSIDVDVWLQTGRIGISQDADNLLFQFPEKREDLFAYDVLLAFDVDWSQVTTEQQSWIESWVSQEGAGIALIAGDAYTYLLSTEDEKWNAIRTLCPVIIDDSASATTLRDSAQQAFAIDLTQEGQAADFLKLEDDPGKESIWRTFPGFYRTQGTRGRRGGATVYAEFTDPLARGIDGPSPLVAGQRYGQGSSFYLGSPEFWRLRSVSEEVYDRFWTKFTRKLAEGRSKRGLQRGMFVLDSREFDLGQTIPVRIRVLNEQFQPLTSPSYPIDVYDAQGRPLTPALVLSQDRFRPAEYTGEFRGDLAGRYRLEMEVPGLSERIREDLQVRLPEREFSEQTQNVAVLTQLADGTGGKYHPLTSVVGTGADNQVRLAKEIADALPDQGERIIVDQRIDEAWDRGWLMGLLVGLLAVEWLSRKFLKLA